MRVSIAHVENVQVHTCRYISWCWVQIWTFTADTLEQFTYQFKARWSYNSAMTTSAVPAMLSMHNVASSSDCRRACALPKPSVRCLPNSTMCWLSAVLAMILSHLCNTERTEAGFQCMWCMPHDMLMLSGSLHIVLSARSCGMVRVRLLHDEKDNASYRWKSGSSANVTGHETCTDMLMVEE